MEKSASLLLAVTLLLPGSFAWAEADHSAADLRYCLELESAYEIAKCAGEIAPGKKGKTFSKEQVDEMLEKKKASAPVPTEEPPGMPPAESKKPGEELPPEKTEGSGY